MASGSIESDPIDHNNGRLETSVCLGVKNIGKPCAGELHARFDEGEQAKACSLLYLQSGLVVRPTA